jgi:hypothetical protein
VRQRHAQQGAGLAGGAAGIRRCGGRKAFACEMWLDKPPRDAHNLLDACLNPERRERLAPGQVIYIAKRGRDVGFHAVMAFLCAEAGYAEPTPVFQLDERAELECQYIEATRLIARMAERIERIERTHQPRAVA